MSSNPEVRSTVDAVRCLYLARVTERAGHHEAARRWRAKAAEWLDKNLPSNRNVRRFRTEELLDISDKLPEEKEKTSE